MTNLALAVLMWAATAGAWAFVIGYSLLAKWWRTDVGRHMWSWGAMVALLLTLIIVTQLLGRAYPGRVAIRLGSYGLLTILIWRQVLLLVRLQIRRRRGPAERTETR